MTFLAMLNEKLFVVGLKIRNLVGNVVAFRENNLFPNNQYQLYKEQSCSKDAGSNSTPNADDFRDTRIRLDGWEVTEKSCQRYGR